MKHFLNDDKGALADLETALQTKYAHPKAEAETIKNSEAGLNERINDYIEKIGSEKDKPRLKESGNSSDH